MTTIKHLQATTGIDSSNISAMITSLQSTGSEVKTLFMSGEFTINEPITVNSNPSIFFQGVNAKITQSSTSDVCFDLSNLSGGGIQDFELVGGGSSNAIRIKDCTDVVIRNISSTEFGSGHLIDYSTDSTTFTNVRHYDNAPSADGMISLIQQYSTGPSNSYQRNVLSYSTDMIALGAKPYSLLTGYWWYDGSDRSRVDPDNIAQIMANTLFDSTGPILMDIEEWDCHHETEVVIQNCRLAAEMYRAGGHREIGFYRLLPYSDYWAGATLRRALIGGTTYTLKSRKELIRKYHKLNDYVNSKIGSYVDFYCPRCYVSYDDSSNAFEEWKYYAGYSILEAKRLAQGKKVYPIIWFNASSPSTALQETLWNNCIDYVSRFPGIDGVMIYSGLEQPSVYDWKTALNELMDTTGMFVP